jgi:hypothetical protein
MAAFWPFQTAANPVARRLTRTPKYVATRTLSELDWDGAHVLDGELEAAVAQHSLLLGTGKRLFRGPPRAPPTSADHVLDDQPRHLALGTTCSVSDER